MPVKALSIHKQYANAIAEGTKTFELRKRFIGMDPGDLVLLYETAPNSVIRSGFIAGETIALPPEEMWEEHSSVLGCDKAFYDEYFQGRELAYATTVLVAAHFSPTTKAWLHSKCPGFVPPQATIKWRRDWPIREEWARLLEEKSSLADSGLLANQLGLFD